MDKIDFNIIERCANELLSNDSTFVETQIELPTHNIEEYSQIQDSFLRYRKMVEDALEIYDKAREIAVVTGTGLSGSINRIAEPFKKGRFTMAVVGKMSAGKSTFINALLGDNALLPTGHFQTTSSLTTIEHSDKKELCVLYEDGHEEIITDNISGVLNKLVAIPEEYSNLPINYINRKIIEGVSPDIISSNESVKKMSKEISKTNIDIDKLKDYIKTHELKDIPREVSIRCPLNENYKGWTLLDTPGVDAVGGMEDETKQLLCGKDDDGCQNVDAIIFVQSAADNIEGESFNEFVNNTVEKLTEEAKQRVFFVLTKGSLLTPLIKEKTISKAKDFFVKGEYNGINANRLVLVDSLATLLANDTMLDFEKINEGYDERPAYWSIEEWEVCCGIVYSVFRELSKQKKEKNNENVRRELSKLSNFSELQTLINDFVKNEKAVTFQKLINLIETDINHTYQIKCKDLEILTNNLGSAPEQFLDNLNKEKENLKRFQIDANIRLSEIKNFYSKKYVRERFQVEVIDEMTEDYFKSIPSIKRMKEKIDEKYKKSNTIRDKILVEIKNKISQFVDSTIVEMNICLPVIDIDEIEQKARSRNTKKKWKSIRLYEKSGWIASISRFFGRIAQKMNINNDLGYETLDFQDYETNETNMISEAASTLYNELNYNLLEFQRKIQEELTAIIDNIDKQIKVEIKQREDDYNEMAKGATIVRQIEKKEQEIAILLKGIENINIYKTA